MAETDVEMAKQIRPEEKIVNDDDDIDIEDDEPKTLFDKCWYAFTKAGEAAGFDVPDIKSLEVENNVVDTSDLPSHWTFNSFVFYQCCFWALAAFFFAQNFILCRTSAFISLQSDAGVCKGEKGSDSCCEVPKAVTGSYLSDYGGRWNTLRHFNYNTNNYVLTMSGVSYTTEEYKQLMSSIGKSVHDLAVRGSNRDYAWNMVAWSSFTAINNDHGSFKFSLSGDPGIIFGKDVIASGFASNRSDAKACSVPISTSTSSSDRKVDVTVGLGCSNPPCVENPCPGILAPQAFGYNVYYSTSSDMTFSLDLASINTALAVNMGILSLDNLVKYDGDNLRLSLLQKMKDNGAITAEIMQNTSSYYESSFAPMNPIYCTSLSYLNTSACFVRVGTTLTYPIINHYGWSANGYDRPSRCTKAASTVSGSAANYYCNKLDLVTGLVYYPIENINVTYALQHSTWSPTKVPTQRPTPPPGSPTYQPTSPHPTRAPVTARPSRSKRPSRSPTAAPTSAAPSVLPTSAPSLASASPTTQEPSVVPTEIPTSVPSISLQPTPVRRSLAESGVTLDRSLLENGRYAKLYHQANSVVVESTLPQSESDYGELLSLSEQEKSLNGIVSEEDIHLETSSGSGGGSGSGSGSGVGGGSSYGGSTFYTNPFSSSYISSPIFPSEGGSSSSTVASGSSSSNNYVAESFVPLIPEVVDNGKIFDLALAQARRLSRTVNSDDYVNRAGYEAMISTISGSAKKTFASDFQKLCGGNNSFSGCAMFAFEVYGGDNRVVNEYLYQPSSVPAYNNIIYATRTMAVISKVPPTTLIETYYSCVMGIWDSVFQAVGLANSSVQTFVTVGFFVYFYLIVSYLTKVKNHDIELLKAKKKRLAREAALRERTLDRVAQVFSSMHAEFNALRDDIRHGDRQFKGFERAVLDSDGKNESANVTPAARKDEGEYQVVPSSENTESDQPR